MEMNLIREDKLKVLLTPFDMMKYELTCEKLDYENTETRKAIWSILDHAKHETGFDAAIGKIRIEVYPEKSGGCAIYITKLKKIDSLTCEPMNETNEKITSLPKTVKTVYEFQETESLIRVCRFLAHRGYHAPSRAFFEQFPDGDIRYFLQITENQPTYPKKMKYLRENLFIEEFGTRLESEESAFYLCEHTTSICKENAVETLAALGK
ncbi:MAG: adaptor protein MecA [Ruminococcaceae bacterium]|nr:adaptor protein MecA [Oscillospiraceae bacterium]